MPEWKEQSFVCVCVCAFNTIVHFINYEHFEDKIMFTLCGNTFCTFIVAASRCKLHNAYRKHSVRCSAFAIRENGKGLQFLLQSLRLEFQNEYYFLANLQNSPGTLGVQLEIDGFCYFVVQCLYMPETSECQYSVNSTNEISYLSDN